MRRHTSLILLVVAGRFEIIDVFFVLIGQFALTVELVDRCLTLGCDACVLRTEDQTYSRWEERRGKSKVSK